MKEMIAVIPFSIIIHSNTIIKVTGNNVATQKCFNTMRKFICIYLSYFSLNILERFRRTNTYRDLIMLLYKFKFYQNNINRKQPTHYTPIFYLPIHHDRTLDSEDSVANFSIFWPKILALLLEKWLTAAYVWSENGRLPPRRIKSVLLIFVCSLDSLNKYFCLQQISFIH